MIEIRSEPNASALMESTRSVGYSFESAIADIVDNSITAKSRNIWIYSAPSSNPCVAILDDGNGMSSSELQEAMRYGVNPNDERSADDLGRFGLGMKMASLSQCRKLTVVSKSVAEGKIVAFRWDLDRVIENNDWTLIMLEGKETDGLPMLDDLRNMQSGTIVIWDFLDRLIDKTKNVEECIADNLIITRDHLALTFHRFMDDSSRFKLRIFINNDEVESADPFLTKHPTTNPLPEQVIRVEGSEIKIKPFILPPVSKLSANDCKLLGGRENLRRLQGFYVYRNKRLIIPGTWFKLTNSKELRKLARVRVDIPNNLDFIWDIDIKKSSATLPPQLRGQFVQFLENVTTQSERVHHFRGRKVNSADKVYIWNKMDCRDEYKYVINREHPLLGKLTFNMDEGSKKDMEDFLRILESSVPFAAIYDDMGSGKNISQKLDDDVIEGLISKGVSLLSVGIKIETLAKIEPFCYYPDVIRKVEEFYEQ